MTFELKYIWKNSQVSTKMFMQQAYVLLISIIVNCLLVSSLQSYEAKITVHRSPSLPYFPNSNVVKFIVHGNPNIRVKSFSTDDNVSAYIINENGDYIFQYPNQGTENQDQFGYSSGGGKIVWTNGGSNALPNNGIKVHTTVIADVDKTDHHGEKHSSGNSDIPVYKVTASPLNSFETIGQSEQRIKEYFGKLLTNQLSQPVTDQIVSSTTVTLGMANNEITVTKAPEVFSKEISTTVSSQGSHSSYNKLPEKLTDQDKTEDENKPAPLDQQPNTLLLTDPFEETYEQYLSLSKGERNYYNYLDWSKQSSRHYHDMTTESNIVNSDSDSNFDIDERVLEPHKYSHMKDSSTTKYAKERKLENYGEKVRLSSEKQPQNIFPSFVSRWNNPDERSDNTRANTADQIPKVNTDVIKTVSGLMPLDNGIIASMILRSNILAVSSSGSNIPIMTDQNRSPHERT